jgi:hypothetical protein
MLTFKCPGCGRDVSSSWVEHPDFLSSPRCDSYALCGHMGSQVTINWPTRCHDGLYGTDKR